MCMSYNKYQHIFRNISLLSSLLQKIIFDSIGKILLLPTFALLLHSIFNLSTIFKGNKSLFFLRVYGFSFKISP